MQAKSSIRNLYHGLMGSLFSSTSTATLSVEEKAQREMCPRVASAWVSLATAVALAYTTDLMADQLIDVMVHIAVALSSRYPAQEVDSMSSDHKG